MRLIGVKVNRIANMSKSAKEIYEASLGLSNAIVLNKRKGKKYDELCNDKEMSFQSIKHPSHSNNYIHQILKIHCLFMKLKKKLLM